jgi:hypothetical protein
MIQEILDQFNDIIVETEFLNVTKIRDLIHYKSKIQFIDGSNLRISEKWHDQKLIQYSYYWLDDENNLIIGWDNAPHHPQVATYPHHKHVQQQTEVHDSYERDLTTILEFIRQKISD